MTSPVQPCETYKIEPDLANELLEQTGHHVQNFAETLAHELVNADGSFSECIEIICEFQYLLENTICMTGGPIDSLIPPETTQSVYNVMASMAENPRIALKLAIMTTKLQKSGNMHHLPNGAPSNAEIMRWAFGMKSQGASQANISPIDP